MGKNKMKKNIATNLLLAILLGIGLAGCDNTGTASLPGANESAAKDAATTTAAPAPAPTPAIDGRDQLDISQLRLLKGSLQANARITRKLYAASKEGDFVNLSFDPLNWPTIGTTKKADGGVFMFWKKGNEVVGGLFDMHKVGQEAKTLVNIYGGYIGGQQPARGARIYFCIVSLDGAQRTNVAESQTRW